MNRSICFPAICFFVAALSVTSQAFDGEDFISASYDPRHPEQSAMVLRVPRTARIASVWNPEITQPPFSPGEAVKMVLQSELVRRTPKDWRLIQVQFWAQDQTMFSNLSFTSGAPPGLITHYTIDLVHLPDGPTYSFMVLMNGKIFFPKPEKQEPTPK